MSDSNMSPEERLNWLRERGVQIETSEERKYKQSNSSDKIEKITTTTTTNNDDDKTNEYRVVSYVHIPHDESKPLTEHTLTLSSSTDNNSNKSGDRLPHHLQSTFRSSSATGAIDLSLLQTTTTTTTTTTTPSTTHMASSGSSPLLHASEAALKTVAERGLVETFCIVQPVTSNKYTSVNIYLDEVGMLKRLPINKRAGDLAVRAGFNPPPIFYGDVFVGRLATKPVIRNINFSKGIDTNPDAPWLRHATMENLEYQTMLNSITGRVNDDDTQQPPIDGTDGIEKSEQEGGCCYSWTQNDDEVEIVVSIPSDATTRDVCVKFSTRGVEGTVKGEEVLRVALYAPIDAEGCTWTLEGGSGGGGDKKLVISCEKRDGTSWPRVTF